MAQQYTPNASPNPNSFAETRPFLEKAPWDFPEQDKLASTNSRLQQQQQRNRSSRNCRRKVLLSGLVAICLVVWTSSRSLGSISDAKNAARHAFDSTKAVLAPPIHELDHELFSEIKAPDFIRHNKTDPAESPLVIDKDEPIRDPMLLGLSGEDEEELFEASPSNTDTSVPLLSSEDLEDVTDASHSSDIVDADSTLLTRPVSPSIPRPAADQERFITYLPHSGYHNQRIALTNALLLGEILNRTVLIPHVRVGEPVGWKEKSRLQYYWDHESKTLDRVTMCQPFLSQLESQAEIKGEATKCSEYNSFAEFSWAMLINLKEADVSVPVVDRPDLSAAYLTSKEGLNLPEDSIYHFPDPNQYEHQFYLSKSHPKLAPNAKGGNYNQRYGLEKLMTPEMNKQRLIEFGSLYGTYRIVLEGEDVDPKWARKFKQIQDAMVFDFPLLDDIATSIRHSMGGPANYVGLHLRVGDGAFQRTAKEHMQRAIVKALTGVFRYTDEQAKAILAEAATRPVVRKRSLRPVTDTWAWVDDERLHDMLEHEQFHALQDRYDRVPMLAKRQAGTNVAEIQCRGDRHTRESWRRLNAHVYIATDARHPREDDILQLFFQVFPCAHILSDFESHVPALEHLKSIKSEEEHLKINRFLAPFLEAIVAASAPRLVGTSGSTFSWFVTSTLHKSYWPRRAAEEAAMETLLASL